MAILMKKIVVIVTLSIVSLFVFFLIDGFIAMFSQSGRGIILKANRFSYEYSALTGIALDLLEKEFGERIITKLHNRPIGSSNRPEMSCFPT